MILFYNYTCRGGIRSPTLRCGAFSGFDGFGNRSVPLSHEPSAPNTGNNRASTFRRVHIITIVVIVVILTRAVTAVVVRTSAAPRRPQPRRNARTIEKRLLEPRRHTITSSAVIPHTRITRSLDNDQAHVSQS